MTKRIQIADLNMEFNNLLYNGIHSIYDKVEFNLWRRINHPMMADSLVLIDLTTELSLYLNDDTELTD